MKKMPSRDTSGKCQGECRNRIFEGEQQRQEMIDQEHMDYSTPSPNKVPWAYHRDIQPGVWGGRV